MPNDNQQVILIKDAKKLGTAITSIRTRGAKLDNDIHTTACSCLFHAAPKEVGGLGHGDVTLMTKLVDAMPKSGRRKALIHWVNEHSMMGYIEKEQRFKMTKAKSKSWKLDKAIETPFWEFTQEKAPTELTIDRLVKLVVSKVTKAQENGLLGEGFTVQGLKTKLNQGLNEVSL